MDSTLAQDQSGPKQKRKSPHPLDVELTLIEATEVTEDQIRTAQGAINSLAEEIVKKLFGDEDDSDHIGSVG